MPDYRRKKKHGFFSVKSNNTSKKAGNGFRVNMRPSKKDTIESLPVPKLIKGKKISTKTKLTTFLVILIIICMILGALYLIFPAGITETLSDGFSSLGSGKYPIDIMGTNVVDVKTESNNYYVLTDSHLYKFNNSGKTVDEFLHGFSNPVVKVSNTRALIYGQGQSGYFVRCSESDVIENNLENDIICGDICNTGVYALATNTDNYTSSVTVYNKKGKRIFVWNCAKDYINSVALSDNGKKIAVSTIGASVGKLSSKIHIFNFLSPDAENSFNYDNSAIYSLKSNKKGFYAVYDSGYDFYRWNNKNKTENRDEFKVSKYNTSGSGAVFVLNRENDRTDNKVQIVSSKGEKTSEFLFKGNISDIKLSGSHIYIISESNVYLYDTEGKKISMAKCGFDYKYISVTGSQKVDVISDNSVESVKIN